MTISFLEAEASFSFDFSVIEAIMARLSDYFPPFLALTAIRAEELFDRNRNARGLPWMQGCQEVAA